MKRIKQQAILEAVLFASGDPVPVSRLCELFDMPKDAVCKLVHSLRDTLDEAGSALAVLVLDNAVQLVTRSEYAPYIKQALSIARSAPLSQAAMEVLAIAAYNQLLHRELSCAKRAIGGGRPSGLAGQADFL